MGSEPLVVRWVALWALIVVACLVPRVAQAHAMTAALTLEPAVPVPGARGRVIVKLIDPYGVALTGVKMRASVAPMDEPAPVPGPLVEREPGIYSGELLFPEHHTGLIRLEAEFYDDRWSAAVAIRLGEAWFAVKDLAVEFEEVKVASPPRKDLLEPLPGAGPAPAPAPAQPAPSPPASAPLPWKGIAVGVVVIVVVGVGRWIRRGLR